MVYLQKVSQSQVPRRPNEGAEAQVPELLSCLMTHVCVHTQRSDCLRSHKYACPNPRHWGSFCQGFKPRLSSVCYPLPTGVRSNRVNLDHLALKPLSAVVCSTTSRPQGPEQKGFFRSNLLPR